MCMTVTYLAVLLPGDLCQRIIDRLRCVLHIFCVFASFLVLTQASKSKNGHHQVNENTYV